MCAHYCTISRLYCPQAVEMSYDVCSFLYYLEAVLALRQFKCCQVLCVHLSMYNVEALLALIQFEYCEIMNANLLSGCNYLYHGSHSSSYVYHVYITKSLCSGVYITETSEHCRTSCATEAMQHQGHCQVCISLGDRWSSVLLVH